MLASSRDPELALAGGAALIASGVVDRATIDLDFFTTAPRAAELIDEIVPALEREGLTVRLQQATPTFARLVVASGTEECQVDVAQDFRMAPALSTALGRALTLEELAADKTLALFTRAEPRDYVDVYFLARRLGKQRLCDLAKEKDVGFDEGAFAQMLRAIGRLDREEFAVDDDTIADLRSFFAAWRDELIDFHLHRHDR